jgi:ABC-type polysaccharide/polyol phosphate export permease
MQKKRQYQNLRILRELVKSDFKLRYQNSYLGYIWTLIKPLLLFGVIYLVFSVFMQSPIPNYPVYLLLGIIIWNFFAEATLIGMNTFLAKRDLIIKIYFSRATLVFASTVSSLITLLLNLVVFFVFIIVARIPVHIEALFFVLYVVELYLVATGMTFILASLYIHFRDLQHIWEVLLQIGFWLTPIIYPITIVPVLYHRYIFLNPLARIIEYSRDIFIRHHIPDLNLNLVLLLMSLVIFVGGYAIFRTQAPRIAEKI